MHKLASIEPLASALDTDRDTALMQTRRPWLVKDDLPLNGDGYQPEHDRITANKISGDSQLGMCHFLTCNQTQNRTTQTTTLKPANMHSVGPPKPSSPRRSSLSERRP